MNESSSTIVLIGSLLYSQGAMGFPGMLGQKVRNNLSRKFMNLFFRIMTYFLVWRHLIFSWSDLLRRAKWVQRENLESQETGDPPADPAREASRWGVYGFVGTLSENSNRFVPPFTCVMDYFEHRGKTYFAEKIHRTCRQTSTAKILRKWGTL